MSGCGSPGSSPKLTLVDVPPLSPKAPQRGLNCPPWAGLPWCHYEGQRQQLSPVLSSLAVAVLFFC